MYELERIEEKENLTVNFKIRIHGIRDVTFKQCDGLDAEVQVVPISEGGRLGAPRTVRGPHLSSRITFSHGSVSPEKSESGKTLFDWFLEVCDSSQPLKKETITILVEGSKKQLGWKVKNAWPFRWSGPFLSSSVNTLTVEQVSFAHEGIEPLRS